MSRARSHSANQPEDFQIKDLAIRGPDAELYDVTDGRRFFYYFEDTTRPLTEVIKAGAVRFTLKFGSRPTLVLLSTAYELKPGELMAGLKVVALEEVPPGHFWFGPKPHFYQLSFDI